MPSLPSQFKSYAQCQVLGQSVPGSLNYLSVQILDTVSSLWLKCSRPSYLSFSPNSSLSVKSLVKVSPVILTVSSNPWLSSLLKYSKSAHVHHTMSEDPPTTGMSLLIYNTWQSGFKYFNVFFFIDSHEINISSQCAPRATREHDEHHFNTVG